MRLELELALRLLSRRTGLLRGTALAAFIGIAAATAALVVTLALMVGYRDAIARPLARGSAHIVAFAGRAMTLEEGRTQAAAAAVVAGVSSAAPVVYLAALAEDPGEPAHPVPVTLKAVDRRPAFVADDGAWGEPERVPAWLGDRLAEVLGLEPGGRLVVRLPPREGEWLLPGLTLEVAGTFHLGFAEFDDSWIVAPLEPVLDRLPGIGASAIEVAVDDPLAISSVRTEVERALPSLVVTDWRDMNRALFAALRWQTLSLYLVLTLVVAVSSFQVSSAMVVLSISKRRATGALQALGMTPSRVRRVLTLAGGLLGGAGLVLGLTLGVAASAVLTEWRLVRFPAELARVYMVDHIPFQVQPLHLVAVAATGGVLVLLASLWPAWRASRLDPVAAFRAG